VVNTTPQLLYPWGMTRYPLDRRLGGPHSCSGQAWKIPENLAPTRIQSTDFPAHCELNRLSHELYDSDPLKISEYTNFMLKGSDE